MPYDVPIIGYETSNIGTLRLWQCEAEEELDFDAFNAQDYQRALDAKNKAEDITRVLYPNDSTWEGKRLRVKQQYVLSSASLQDIIRTYKRGPWLRPEPFRRLYRRAVERYPPGHVHSGADPPADGRGNEF